MAGPEFADLRVLQDDRLVALDRPMTMRHGLQQEVWGAIIARVSGYTLDEGLHLSLAADQSPVPLIAGVAAGEKPKYLLSIAGLYSTAQDYLRFAQMLANGGMLDGVRMLAPTSVTLMTSNLLPAGVPMRFLQPFAGVGYGMGVGIVLDPAQADFNGGTIGAGSYFWGGVHGTWFWVDPTYDIIVIGMVQQEGAGNGMTGRPYPVPDLRAMSRSLTYQALVDPAR